VTEFSRGHDCLGDFSELLFIDGGVLWSLTPCSDTVDIGMHGCIELP
jgi:hypothetical protein